MTGSSRFAHSVVYNGRRTGYNVGTCHSVRIIRARVAVVDTVVCSSGRLGREALRAQFGEDGGKGQGEDELDVDRRLAAGRSVRRRLCAERESFRGRTLLLVGDGNYCALVLGVGRQVGDEVAQFVLAVGAGDLVRGDGQIDDFRLAHLALQRQLEQSYAVRRNGGHDDVGLHVRWGQADCRLDRDGWKKTKKRAGNKDRVSGNVVVSA